MVVCFLGAVIYLDLRGFPVFLKEFVENQLARQGVAARFSSIRIDVFRGIVAKDAVLADAQTPERVLARIDVVQIDWHWRRLIEGGNAIDALRIANATISVPTPPDEIGSAVFQAAEAFATFRFEDDGAIQIDQLTGVYAGIRLRLAGRIKPRARGAEEQLTTTQQFVFITKALRELDRLYGTQPPQLDLQFELDLGAPLDSRVTAKLFAAAVNYRNLPVEKLTVDLHMLAGAIDLRDVTLRVGKGELTLRGRYDVAAGNFDLELASSLDPNLFLPTLPPEITGIVRDFRVFDPPNIAIRYRLGPETGVLPVMDGRVEFGALECRSVPFRRIAFTFANQGASLEITNALIVMKEGQLTGHGRYNIETSDFIYHVDSTLDPVKLLPLLPPIVREIVEPAWFEKPPRIKARVHGDFVDPDAFGYDATITARRCAYRGVSLTGASANIKVRHSKLDATNIVVQRPEGDVRGWVFANFNTERIALDLVCTANPTALIPLLGPQATEVMHPYRFGSRTHASGQALIDIRFPSNTVLRAAVTNEGFSYWKLTAGKAVADITITNNILAIDNFDGEFYGGKLRGRASFTLSNAGPYWLDFAPERVEIRDLLNAMTGQTNTSSGKLTGAAWIEGQGDDQSKIAGVGKLTIEDGVLWELPLFGIFSRILNEIGGGLGTTKATKATASFTLADKAAKTDDLTVAAGAFTLTAPGKVGFDGKLDFRVKGQLLRGVPGLNILTWFFSNVFEYKIGGTLGDYSYRPVNLPKEFLPHDGSKKNNPNAN
ncbi:MAG: hypothetical protein PCFJNLEI_00133 [Verrucomicrobiae bacterium]|nr:hypothetical protein [Verrucomicrobiae bacterium]